MDGDVKIIFTMSDAAIGFVIVVVLLVFMMGMFAGAIVYGAILNKKRERERKDVFDFEKRKQ